VAVLALLLPNGADIVSAQTRDVPAAASETIPVAPVAPAAPAVSPPLSEFPYRDGPTAPATTTPATTIPTPLVYPAPPVYPPAPVDNGTSEPPRSAGGLPDAVTVLEIIRNMPRWPGSASSTNTRTSRPATGPKPLGGQFEEVPVAGPRPPRRVVTLNPSQPFVPRPLPRSIVTPPVIAGAVVSDVRPREVIVTLGPNSTAATVFELSQGFGLDGDTLYTSNLLGMRVVRFRIPDTRSIADVVQQLSGDARVQLAQPHYVFTANQAAAKPLPIPQYAPQKLHLDEAHKLAQGNRVKVAIIDTAIDQSHPVFGGAIAATFDALGETKPQAELHGTSIAGIVSARAELTGVAPLASIFAVRAFSGTAASSAQSYTLAILKGLDWAVLNGARVVNMSFSGPNDPLLGQAIAAAVKQGVVIVAAAGNGGPDAPPAYPGAFPNVIAVTAIDSKDGLYKSANRGTYIAIAAPGVDIIGAAPKAAYELSSGTSMAAAHVTGIVALMLEKNPKLTPKDVRDALSKSAHQPPRLIAEDMGAGIVDAADALGAVK
jgi:subtilisin family serine protease